MHLANEKGLETARTVVPLQSLAIPIPQLEAVFFLTVLVSEVIRLAHVPIFKSDRSAIGHPEESTFLGLVRTRGPKVLVSKTEILNMFLQSVVLLLRRYARQMHPVISAILRRSVPIGLEEDPQVISFLAELQQRHGPSGGGEVGAVLVHAVGTVVVFSNWLKELLPRCLSLLLSSFFVSFLTLLSVAQHIKRKIVSRH